jgi:Inositol polyphosphate kinase
MEASGLYLISDAVISIALMFIPICGLALRRALKTKEELTLSKQFDSDPEVIFNSAIEGFISYTGVTDNPMKASDALKIDDTAVYNHQVAGHTGESLRAFHGKVLKPMLKRRLFIRELCLYEKMRNQKNNIPGGLPMAFVPNYTGLALVKVARTLNQEVHLFRTIVKVFGVMWSKIFTKGELHFLNQYSEQCLLPHLVLEDLASNYREPCVIDIKMGQQTYEPGACRSKKMREIRKCPYQVMTGFRITGMKVYDITSSLYTCEDKQFGRLLKPGEAAEALKSFFWNGETLRKDVINGVIKKLTEILAWFARQSDLHFYCSSILIIYDGLSDANSRDTANRIQCATANDRGASLAAKADLVQVKMIDFAHTLPSPVPSVPDHGYILGLKTLINALKGMV